MREHHCHQSQDTSLQVAVRTTHISYDPTKEHLNSTLTASVQVPDFVVTQWDVTVDH